MDALPLQYISSAEPVTDPARVSARRSDSMSMAAINRQSLDMTITTAENDRVTLNASSGTTASFAVYQGDGTVALASSVTQEQAFDLTVQGTLSKAETRDIAQAIQAYSKVVKDTLNGRVQAADAHARKLGRLEEISSFEGAYSSSQSYSAELRTTGN